MEIPGPPPIDRCHQLLCWEACFLCPLGKTILWSAILVNILALLFYKYNNFFLADLISLLGKLGIRIGAGGIQLLAPLGISFITLQMISYLIDIYYQRVEAEGSFIKFALYVVYFPKLLAGPIERIKPFLDQVDAPQELTEQTVKRSISLVVVGLVRKLILADSLIVAIPADVFQKPSQYPSLLLVLWLLAYAFALYNDFAGYTNIVIGISGFFGIELTNNFNVPYFSRSFSEFWNLLAYKPLKLAAQLYLLPPFPFLDQKNPRS